jgi:hypothetical protein
VWNPKELNVGDRVEVTVGLAFIDRALKVGATVTQVVADGVRFGIALALDDLDRVTALIAEALGGAR